GSAVKVGSPGGKKIGRVRREVEDRLTPRAGLESYIDALRPGAGHGTAIGGTVKNGDGGNIAAVRQHLSIERSAEGRNARGGKIGDGGRSRERCGKRERRAGPGGAGGIHRARRKEVSAARGQPGNCL